MKAALSAEARADVLRIDTWWRANQPYAPDLFSEEGCESYKSIEGSSARRTLMPRTRHNAYHDVDGDLVVVVAVWSTLRSDGPPLSSK